MKSTRYYKANPTNVKKNHIAGNFKNSGQKVGKKSLNKAEMETNREAGVQAKVRKISKALFKKRMMVSEHSQFNA